MVDVHVNHAFVSLKTDSPDPTLVSSSEWNSFLNFTNGGQGQIPARNTLAATGATWIDAPVLLRPSDAYGGTAVNSPALCTTTITVASNALVLIFPSVLVVMTAGTGCILSVFRQGSSIGTGQIRADGTWTTPFPTAITEAPGTYTYAILLSGTSGSITSAQALMTTLVLGKL